MSQPGARAQAVAANELYDDLLLPVHEGDRGLAVQRIAQAIQAAVEAKRERCAKIADEYPKRDPAEDGNGYWAAQEIAQAIRQEGEASNPTDQA